MSVFKVTPELIKSLGFELTPFEKIQITISECEWRSSVTTPHNPDLNHLIEFTEDVSHWRPCLKRITEYLTSDVPNQIRNGSMSIDKALGTIAVKGANGECVKTEFHKSDYITHHHDFVTACELTRDNFIERGDRDSALYWEKQLRVLKRLEKDYHPKTPEQKLHDTIIEILDSSLTAEITAERIIKEVIQA